MSDFFNIGWSIWISVIAILGIIFCLWLLYTQRANAPKDFNYEEEGKVWDGDITELDTPAPRWFTVMYVGLCVFAFGYLLLYPGLGSFKGLLGWTAAKQVHEEQMEVQERLEPLYARFADMEIEEIAADLDAAMVGQRLFLNNCAQCHGSDAKGSSGFPNLTDDAWMWGGEPEQILETITNGRTGVMTAHASMMTPAEASDIAQYIRSLNNLAHDSLRVNAGERLYAQYCVACHGADATGNQALGAPNLTDNNWLYDSSEKTIVEGILQGRNNTMPAQKDNLTPEQIRVLSGWVWGLSNNPKQTAQAN